MRLLRTLFLFLALSSCAFETSAFAETQEPSSVQSSPIPSPSPTVQVAQPSAPPQWAQDLMVNAEKLPLVGPYVSKFLLYLGILSAIMTSILACILSVLNSLMGVMNLAGLTDAATKIANFRDGKFMYWLKYFSLFNAKKPGPQ